MLMSPANPPALFVATCALDSRSSASPFAPNLVFAALHSVLPAFEFLLARLCTSLNPTKFFSAIVDISSSVESRAALSITTTSRTHPFRPASLSSNSGSVSFLPYLLFAKVGGKHPYVPAFSAITRKFLNRRG